MFDIIIYILVAVMFLCQILLFIHLKKIKESEIKLKSTVGKLHRKVFAFENEYKVLIEDVSELQEEQRINKIKI